MLLPALLADLLFAGKQHDACLAVEEPNPAMADLEQGYCEAVFRKAGLGGKVLVSADRAAGFSRIRGERGTLIGYSICPMGRYWPESDSR